MATYYVNAATGDDATGDGSVGNPWQTLGHAETESFSSGDIIDFTGAESIDDPLDFGVDRIHLRGAGRGSASITCSGSWSGSYIFNDGAARILKVSGVDIDANGESIQVANFSATKINEYIQCGITGFAGSSTVLTADHVRECEVYSNTSTGIAVLMDNGTIVNSWVHDNSGPGIRLETNATADTTVSSDNAGDGFELFQSELNTCRACVAYNNSASGFDVEGGNNTTRTGNFVDCIAESNGAYGFEFSGENYATPTATRCFSYSNTSGSTSGTFTGTVTALTESAFADAASDDFNLTNASAGGGDVRGSSFSMGSNTDVYPLRAFSTGRSTKLVSGGLVG